MRERTKLGERIGGGFIVMRRGKKTGRLGVKIGTCPFEHPDYTSAKAEANRMAVKHPGERFVVWGQVDQEPTP